MVYFSYPHLSLWKLWITLWITYFIHFLFISYSHLNVDNIAYVYYYQLFPLIMCTVCLFGLSCVFLVVVALWLYKGLHDMQPLHLVYFVIFYLIMKYIASIVSLIKIMGNPNTKRIFLVLCLNVYIPAIVPMPPPK